MTRSPLFAHLAIRLGAQPDRLATEVLGYLLARAPMARQAITSVCAVAVPDLVGPDDLPLFCPTPRGPGLGAPILLGLEADGAARVVVDCRFWSRLAEGQPLDLLGLLASDRPSVLLLVAPTRRFTSLWAEARRRCREAGLPVHGDRAAGDSLRWTRVGPHQTVMLVSWGTVLAGVMSRLVAGGDESAVADLEQLAAFCDVQEAGTFGPLTDDEMAAVSPRRLAELFGLVDDLAAVCQDRGLGSLDAAPRPAEPGWYGRRLRLGLSVFELCLSVGRWATLRDTPFWLLVYDLDDRPARGSDGRLERLASEIPPRLLRDAETECPLVPLFPPVGVDRDGVLAGLAEQVSEVARLLGESPTVGFGSRD